MSKTRPYRKSASKRPKGSGQSNAVLDSSNYATYQNFIGNHTTQKQPGYRKKQSIPLCNDDGTHFKYDGHKTQAINSLNVSQENIKTNPNTSPGSPRSPSQVKLKKKINIRIIEQPQVVRQNLMHYRNKPTSSLNTRNIHNKRQFHNSSALSSQVQRSKPAKEIQRAQTVLEQNEPHQSMNSSSIIKTSISNMNRRSMQRIAEYRTSGTSEQALLKMSKVKFSKARCQSSMLSRNSQVLQNSRFRNCKNVTVLDRLSFDFRNASASSKYSNQKDKVSFMKKLYSCEKQSSPSQSLAKKSTGIEKFSMQPKNVMKSAKNRRQLLSFGNTTNFEKSRFNANLMKQTSSIKGHSQNTQYDHFAKKLFNFLKSEAQRQNTNTQIHSTQQSPLRTDEPQRFEKAQTQVHSYIHSNRDSPEKTSSNSEEGEHHGESQNIPSSQQQRVRQQPSQKVYYNCVQNIIVNKSRTHTPSEPSSTQGPIGDRPLNIDIPKIQLNEIIQNDQDTHKQQKLQSFVKIPLRISIESDQENSQIPNSHLVNENEAQFVIEDQEIETSKSAHIQMNFDLFHDPPVLIPNINQSKKKPQLLIKEPKQTQEDVDHQEKKTDRNKGQIEETYKDPYVQDKKEEYLSQIVAEMKQKLRQVKNTQNDSRKIEKMHQFLNIMEQDDLPENFEDLNQHQANLIESAPINQTEDTRIQMNSTIKKDSTVSQSKEDTKQKVKEKPGVKRLGQSFKQKHPDVQTKALVRRKSTKKQPPNRTESTIKSNQQKEKLQEMVLMQPPQTKFDGKSNQSKVQKVNDMPQATISQAKIQNNIEILDYEKQIESPRVKTAIATQANPQWGNISFKLEPSQEHEKEEVKKSDQQPSQDAKMHQDILTEISNHFRISNSNANEPYFEELFNQIKQSQPSILSESEDEQDQKNILANNKEQPETYQQRIHQRRGILIVQQPLKRVSHTTIKPSDIERFILNKIVPSQIQTKKLEFQNQLKFKDVIINQKQISQSQQNLDQQQDQKEEEYQQESPIRIIKENDIILQQQDSIQREIDQFKTHKIKHEQVLALYESVTQSLHLSSLEKFNEKQIIKNDLDINILNNAVKKLNYDAILFSYYFNERYMQSKSTRDIEFENIQNQINICRFQQDLVQNQQLVSIHDLKSSNFKAKNITKKLRINREFMKEMGDLQDSIQSEDDNQILSKFENSISVRLLKNISSSIKQKVTQTHFLFELNQELLDKFKKQNVLTLQSKLKKAAIEMLTMKMRQQTDMYNHQCDTRWAQKNNKPSFLYLDDPQMLEKKTKPISLFDVKTKCSVEEIYAEMDWEIIEKNQTLLKKKQIEILKQINPQVQYRVDQILQNNERLNWYLRGEMTCDLQSSHDCTLLRPNLLINVHQTCLKTLVLMFKFNLRDTPLFYKHQMGMLLKPIKDKIFQDHIERHRFDKILNVISFRQVHEQTQQKMRNLDDKLESQRLVNSFQDHLACSYVSQNDRFNFQKILFKQDLISLYKKLYNPDMDLTLYMIIEKVFQIQKKKEIFKSFKKVIKKPLVIDKIHISLQSSKYRTQEDLDPYSHKLVKFGINQEVQKFLRTKTQPFKFQKVACETFIDNNRFLTFVSQKGVYFYNDEKLEFLVCQMLTDNLPVIKDSINVFYKGINQYLDQESSDYNELLKRHGFKSQFVRDPKNVRFLMEVFKPVLLKKAKRKIKMREQHLVNLKKSFIEKGSVKEIKQELAFSTKVQVKSAQKIIKQVQADDFLTDDSMKGIDYRDIDMIKSNSEESDSHDDEHHDKCKASKQKLTQLLCSTETPVEYYAKLRKIREAEEEASGNMKTDPNILEYESHSDPDNNNSQSSTQRFMAEIKKSKKHRPKVFHAEAADEKNQENSTNLVRNAQKNKALDKFMYGILQNVDSDNLEDLAKKQAELNIAKSILEKVLENQQSKSQFSKNEFQTKQDKRNAHMVKKVINDANEQRLKVIKRMALVRQYDQEYAKKLSQNIVKKIDKEQKAENGGQGSHRSRKQSFQIPSEKSRNFTSLAGALNSNPQKMKIKTEQSQINSSEMTPNQSLMNKTKITSLTVREESDSMSDDSQTRIGNRVRKKLDMEIKQGFFMTEDKRIKGKLNKEIESGFIRMDADSNSTTPKFQNSSSNTTNHIRNRANSKRQSTKIKRPKVDVKKLTGLGLTLKMIRDLQNRVNEYVMEDQILKVVTNKALFHDKTEVDFMLRNEIQILEKLDTKTRQNLEIKAKKQEKKKQILQQLSGIGKQNSKQPPTNSEKSKKKRHKYECKVAQLIKQTLVETHEKIHQSEKNKDKNMIWGSYHQHEMPEIEDEMIEGRLCEHKDQIYTTQTTVNSQNGDDTIIPVNRGLELQLYKQKRMQEAVKNMNAVLMADILRRFPGKTVDVIDDYGNGLVANAAKYADLDMIQVLAENGFSVSNQNFDGNTPLHFAISSGSKSIIQILLQFGANESIENNEGKTPWQMVQ